MKRSWKLVPVVTLVFSLAFSTVAPAAEDKESVFPATLQGTDPQRVFSIGDDTRLGFSQLGIWPNKLCKSTKDPVCDFKNAVWGAYETTIQASALLNVCTPAENEDCIESIEISRDGTTYSQLKFDRYVVGGTCDSSASAGCAFPPDPEMRLPRGGNLSIWSEIVDGQVKPIQYLVTYEYQMNYDDKNKYFVLNNVGLAIRPMKEIATTRWDSLWFENGKSGIQYDFQPDINMRATVHLSNKTAGWFRARLQDVNIEILPFSKNNTKLVVSGKAVSVPNFAVKRPIAEMNANEKDFAGHFGYNKGVVGAESGSSKIFDYLEYWRTTLKDTSAFTNTYWSLNSTRWLARDKCLNDTTRVVGVVSTNAMGYDSNAPAFQDGFLNYKVSGFHYAPDGVTTNLGTYDLVLRSDAARCLYGFSDAPISATVEIAGADGKQNIATTVVSEKDGWLKMKAAGFTYSEKQIKVKITQEGSVGKPVSEKVEPISPIVNKVKKSSITCVKGKVTRKVTAVSPKCPGGYKKKAQLKPRLVQSAKPFSLSAST